MRRSSIVRGFTVLALTAAAGSSVASAVTLTDNFVATQSGAIGGLSALDITSVVSGLTTSNSYSTSFSSSVPGAYTGSMTATVYGNNVVGSSSLTEVLIIYSFVGNGPSGIENFELGLDSGSNLDYGDLLAAMHGTVGDMRSTNPTLQGSPLADLTDNIATNDTLNFAFAGALNPGGDVLGTFSGTETFGWYVRASGAVKIGFVDVVVTDFGTAAIQTLGLVDVPGQPDLNVPGPGALGLLAVGLGLSARRRRA